MTRRPYPNWQTNIALCLMLVLLIGGYFLYQVQQASEQFRRNSREHSKVLAAAVELNLRNTLLSNQGLESVIETFLANSVSFIRYLDAVQEFTPTELAAFARETGLAGITIVGDEAAVAGPEDWHDQNSCQEEGLQEIPEKALYLYQQPGGSGESCIIVGFPTVTVEHVRREISVERLLTHLHELPGIAYVRLESATDGEQTERPAELLSHEGRRISETRLALGDRDLVVGQEAGHFARRLGQMRLDFFLFTGFLAIFGLLSSWWLYRSQKLRLLEVLRYEKEMARQHEEAALGRATATIAHEIRNPLNAIGMGLQRLQIEPSNLSPEHRQLLESMREAVARSNRIITNLQQFVGAMGLRLGPVDMSRLINQVAALYGPACKAQGISVVLPEQESYTIEGDGNLLGQLLENCFKNAVEAQPSGGYLQIGLSHGGNQCRITMVNGGYQLGEGEEEALFEPYFTTKTQGSGLGLAISRKIAEAHGGSLQAAPDSRQQRLQLIITLPTVLKSP